MLKNFKNPRRFTPQNLVSQARFGIKQQRSFGLIEIMISIVILTVGIGGAIVVLNNIVSNFRLATNVFIANNLAIEGIEVVGNIRDRNLLAGILWPHGLTVGNHQVDFNDTFLTPHIGGILNIITFFQHLPGYPTTLFRRRIEISLCPDIPITDCLQIKSIVTWVSFVKEERSIVVTRLFRGRDI